MSKVQAPSVTSRVCDVFEQGCMYCANRPPTTFNPDNYPQKMHIAEMAYSSPEGTLYVRETTAEVEQTPGDDYIAPVEKKTPEPALAAFTDLSSPNFFKGLKQSCSGITFIEEKEEKAKEAKYIANVKIKLEQRAIWNAFLKHIDRSKKLQQLRGIGPNWFQELSSNQIALLDSLPAVLKADTDEKSITYTRRFLNELGTPPIESRNIEKAVLDCELDPLFFLARIQKEVHYIESKKPNPISELSNFHRKKRSFTVSERILLSSIVHLHMPVLLFKLHLILPLPVENKAGKLKNPIAPLEQPTKLPEPKKEWYKPDVPTSEFESMLNELDYVPNADSKGTINKQVEDSPSIWTMASIPPIRERKSQFFNTSFDAGKAKEGQQASSQLSDKDGTKIEETTDASLFPSFQSFYQGMEPSESNYFLMESFTQTNISFHANVPIIRPQMKHIKECDSETEKEEEEVTDLLPPSLHKADRVEKMSTANEYSQTDSQWLPANTSMDVIQLFGSEYAQEVLRRMSSADRGNNTDLTGKEELQLEDVITNIIAMIVRKPTENELMRKEMLQKCLEQNNVNGLYNIFGLEMPERYSTSSAKKFKPKTGSSISSKTGSSISKQRRSSGLGSQKMSSMSKKSTEEDAEDELDLLLTKIRDEVKKHEIHEELKFALKLLAAAGDPVADFPQLQKHPVIRRWFEIRRGIKRKLSEKEKDRMMDKSRKAWNCLLTTVNDIKSPKINVTPDQLAKFTWDKRQWLKKQAQLVQTDFSHELRQALVDDARILYPTMATNYYDSKLNKNLRKVFFTYLPAKENDYFVFKPWKSEDVKNKKEVK